MTISHIDPEYQANTIEPSVQQDWENRKVFKVADTVEGKHRYILSMFLTQWQTAHGSCA